MRNGVFLGLFFWVFCSLALRAETEFPPDYKLHADPALSLRDVVDAALSRSPDRLMIKSRQEIATALKRKSSSFFSDSPEIAISHQNDSLGSNQGLREWEGSLNMPLWLPGEKSANRKKARMSQAEADAYKALMTWQVAGEVRQILWDIKLAEATVRENRKSLEMARSLDRNMKKQIAAGNLPGRDALLSRQETMSREMALITAQSEYFHAGQIYQKYTGLDRIPADFTEQMVERETGENLPLINLANARVDYLRAEFREITSRWNSPPTLSLGVRRERGAYQDRNIDSVSLGLSFPLGGRVHAAPKRAAAAVTLADAERQREMVRRSQSLQLHEAHHEYETCRAQLLLAEEHFSLAGENLRLGQKSYELGESDMRDFLRIREQYFDSSRKIVTQKITCQRAVARHNQVKGILP